MRRLVSALWVSFFLGTLSSCSMLSIETLSEKSGKIFKSKNVKERPLASVEDKTTVSLPKVISLSEIVTDFDLSVDVDNGFKVAVREAVVIDPSIISAEKQIKAFESKVASFESGKEFQVSGTIMGGVEDVTDDEKGVAILLDARRLLFDGGVLDAQIAAEQFRVEAQQQYLKASYNKRAGELAGLWVDLERYSDLNNLVDERLRVLEPLIAQLEKVTEAGVGDVTQVAAAQRTVSMIKVAKSDVLEKLKQAELNFINSYGSLPQNTIYDVQFIGGLVPSSVDTSYAQNAPALLAEYANYKAADADLKSISAKSSFEVGLEARARRPFAGSGYDSDESIGIVARKTLFDGEKLESDIREAEFRVQFAIENLKVALKDGEKEILQASEKIVAMDQAILLARADSKVAADEVSYLRKQLIIGGSTLDSVLSAEARLYNAEKQEISFVADKRLAQIAVVSALGLLAPALGL